MSFSPNPIHAKGIARRAQRPAHHRSRSLHYESLESRELFSTSNLSSLNQLAALQPGHSTTDKATQSSAKGAGFNYYRYGLATTDVTSTPQPGLALEGGGANIDQVFQWLGSKAQGGDVLFLGTSGKDAYDSYVYKLNLANPLGGLPLNSVSTLVISSRAASSDPFVLDKVNHAEAIFIEGGDQSTYVNLWKGTPLQDAINAAVNSRHVALGGTSAGLAVMGQYLFSAQNGSAYSNTVLANPYDSTVTLDQNFLNLPLMQNTITDPHFYERDRMGRLVTFLDRLVTDYSAPVAGTKGIGIDEETALLVELNPSSSAYGYATVVANPVKKDLTARHVYFLETTGVTAPGVPNVSQPNTPLTYQGIAVQRAGVGDVFSLIAWSEVSGADWSLYTILAMGSVLSSTQSNRAIY